MNALEHPSTPSVPTPAITHRNAAFSSRNSNPFATCWTRPGALAFRFADVAQTVDSLVDTLAAQQWRGEIRGPHGSGKSTLLASLVPQIEARGLQIESYSLRDAQRRLPHGVWNAANRHLPTARLLVVIDGYEQLGWLERAKLSRFCRRTGIGLLVTSHAPTRLPLLIEIAPTAAVIQALVRDLCEHSPAAVSCDDIRACHACHGSNVREIFFELYDRYEALRPRG